MRRIIAVTNQKGGVAKTTVTINLGAALSNFGRKVLLVDLDPQAHLSYSLGVQAHDLRLTTREVLNGDTSALDARVYAAGMAVIASTLELAGADMELASVAAREMLLRDALADVKEYDYILIDCPPSLGTLTYNGLTAATDVLIPVQSEFLAMQGLQKLESAVTMIRRRLNKQLNFAGIIATRYDARKNLHREALEELQKRYPKQLYQTVIRENIALAEAPSWGKTILDYKPDSNGAADFLALGRELVKRMEGVSL